VKELEIRHLFASKKAKKANITQTASIALLNATSQIIAFKGPNKDILHEMFFTCSVFREKLLNTVHNCSIEQCPNEK